MKIIIQCAGLKRPEAQTLVSSEIVANFVANPKVAPPIEGERSVAPDDLVGLSDKTWRDVLLNSQSPEHGLMPAYRLYRRDIYSELAKAYGTSNMYILSAGWGLVNSTFRLPRYDITFSNRADPYKRRRPRDNYADFCHLNAGDDPVVFFGGKDYFPLLCKLLGNQERQRIAFFKTATAARPKYENGWEMRPFISKARMWHYEAAKALIGGEISL